VAYMGTDSLNEAIKSLQEWEKTSRNNIGFVSIIDRKSRCGVIKKIENEIKKWAEERRIDAVIWTDLPSNFTKKTGKDFTIENAIEYLKNLDSEIKEKAKEYIKKAPYQIRTKVRTRIEEELGW